MSDDLEQRILAAYRKADMNGELRQGDTVNNFEAGFRAALPRWIPASEIDREGYYLLRGAGRTQPELYAIRSDDGELCLFTIDDPDLEYFNLLRNLNPDIEYKFVEPLPTPPEREESE